MKETVYNLFVYISTADISELGVAAHDLEGTDQEKLAALQDLVNTDYQQATRYKPKQPLTWENYESLMRLGRELGVFEGVFQDIQAPHHPLVVITPVKDGNPFFEAVTNLGPPRQGDFKGTVLEEPGTMVDYLNKYITENRFDIPRLINDDYFLAMKLLFNTRHFDTSCPAQDC